MPENQQPESRQSEAKPLEQTNRSRRRRFARSALELNLVSLTPAKVEILRFLAELRFLSLPQIARLCCPGNRQDLSEKSARRHMRALFDAGLVDVLAVSRAALAPLGAPNDASLLYGSAPNVYAPTARGMDALLRAGLADRPDADRKKPAYGPKNSLFLAHELAVRDVRVWLEVVAREGGYELESWQDGESAAISLHRDQAPFSVRPDAWFVLRLSRAVLVGLVEMDRGTERGDRRWQEKLTTYEPLFSTGALKAATGYINARVLVIAPSEKRRDHLATMIATHGNSAIPRFWIAAWSMLKAPLRPSALGCSVWRRPGGAALEPLVGNLVEA